jgi:hypothetical protein
MACCQQLAIFMASHRTVPPVTPRGLRSRSKPHQSWKPNRTTMATEVALEFVDREASIMLFPLQHAKCHQTAGQMRPLSPLRARLIARPAELSFAHADDLLDLGLHAINRPTSAAGRVRRLVAPYVAPSDHQDWQAPRQPATLRPLGVSAVGTHSVPVEPAVLLQAAHAIPPIVAPPLQQPSGGILGIEPHIFGAAAQAIAGLAQRPHSCWMCYNIARR